MAAAPLPGETGPYSLAYGDQGHPVDPGVPGFTGPDGPGAVTPANRQNPAFIAWASEVVSYDPADQAISSEFSDPAKALGPATGEVLDTVSLGDLTAAQLDAGFPPGSITLGFDLPIGNGAGADFAVFENGFGAPEVIFGELAFIEVSSNGVDFARFPAHSLTPGPVPSFAPLDPTRLWNLAGKHANGNGASFGTPFDLDDISTSPLVLAGMVDLDAIRFVRVVDIPGRGDFSDAWGNPVYDPWPTSGSGGADIDAVGVLNAGGGFLRVDPPGPSPPWRTDMGPSLPTTITLHNAGTQVVTVTAVEFEAPPEGGMRLLSAPPPLEVAPGQAVDLLVAYDPAEPGAASAVVRVVSDAVNTPVVVVAVEVEGIAAPPSGWTRVGGGPTGQGRQPGATVPDGLDTAAWSSGPAGFETGGSLALYPGDRPLVVGWGGDRAGTPADGRDDTAFVLALDAGTGTVAWQSPDIDPGNSLAFDSWHTPTADPDRGNILVAMGGAITALDARDGSVAWRTPLDAGGSSDVVNGSVTVEGDRAFVATYGGFNPAAKRLYAVDAGTGAVLWSAPGSGPGSESVAVVRNGLGTTVFTLTAGGMEAYDAGAGSLRWSSNAPLSGEPWTTFLGFFGGLAYHDGLLVAPTYNFGGGAELVGVDAETGALRWKNNNALSSDSTPCIVGGHAIVSGHRGFGESSYVAAYELETGAESWRREVSPASTNWNVSAVAYEDAVVVTLGDPGTFGGAPAGLLVLDPATGAPLFDAATTTGGARGTPAIGPDGTLYVLQSGGGVAAYAPRRLPSAWIVTGETE